MGGKQRGERKAVGSKRSSFCFPPSSQILPAHTIFFLKTRIGWYNSQTYLLIFSNITLWVSMFLLECVVRCEHAVLMKTRRGHQIL